MQRLDFRPRVCKADQYGRLGRVMLLRYHPFVSSSNPMGQVCLRCNWDVQCLDRVPVQPDVIYGGTQGVSFHPRFNEKYGTRQDWREVPVSSARDVMARSDAYIYGGDAEKTVPTERGYEFCMRTLRGILTEKDKLDHASASRYLMKFLQASERGQDRFPRRRLQQCCTSGYRARYFSG